MKQFALLAVLVLLAACTSSDTPTRTLSRTASPTTSAAPTSYPAPQAKTCGAYAAPDPYRPRMTLSFTVSDDHTTVRGTERIVFRPDLPVTELVFRLSANTPPTEEAGNGITVTAAKADHGAGAPRYTRANAPTGTQGGLLHLAFAKRLPAGTVITADLAFTIRLGKPYFDRFGRSAAFAYFGSAQPLLAWQRGVGWHTEDLASLTNETTTSEAMDVDLTVRAPGKDIVIMSGDPADPPASAGLRTWHSQISTARDVSVAVGPFRTADVHVGTTKVRVGAPTTALIGPVVTEAARAIRLLAARFGPFPFPSLSLARIPVNGGGIEYPSSIFLFGSDRYIVVHEIAHQWFYAMVGNSQALHPWLDEAFATYAEQLTDGVPTNAADLARPGRVDTSTEAYGDRVYPFVYTIYNKGSAALRTARDQAGANAWDAAIRCYVSANAWRIAVPTDVTGAVAKLTAGLAVLRKAGAVP